jgi:hypothetical protein
MSATTEVVGVGVYLELVRPDELKSTWEDTKQMIILPSYTSDSGDESPAIIMSRDVNELSPKAQWDFYQYAMGIGQSDDFLTDPEQVEIRKPESYEFGYGEHIFPHFQYDPDYTRGWSVASDAKYDEIAREKMWATMTTDERNRARGRAMEMGLRNALIRSTPDYEEENGGEPTLDMNWIPRLGEGSKPIYVEVTNDDMECVINNKTPQALIRRIQKVRVARGLPEKVVIEKATASS